MKLTTVPARRFGALPWGNPATSPYWRLALLDPTLWERPRHATERTVSFANFKAGTTGVQSFTVKRSGPFVIQSLTGIAINFNAGPPLVEWGSAFTPNVNQPSQAMIQISDSRNDYDWFSRPIPLDNLAGCTAFQPGAAFFPYVAEAGTMIIVTLTSTNLPGSGTDWDYRLVFRGVEVV